MSYLKKSKRNLSLIFSIKKVKNQRKWTREEDELLIVLAEKFNEKHWKEISKRFVNKNSLQCFSRYKRIRPGIIKGSWKKEEDLKILNLVEKHGKSWSKIAKLFGSRNGKQIRDRFINVLDPEIKKGKFLEEEDLTLVSLFKSLGPKWATIAKFFPNRTADMIKNRFHSSIKKRISDLDESKIIPYKKEDYEKNTYKFETNEDSVKEAFDFNLIKENNGVESSFISVCDANKEYIDTFISKDCDNDYYLPLNEDKKFNFESCYNDNNNDNNNNNNSNLNFQNLNWNFEDFFTV